MAERQAKRNRKNAAAVEPKAVKKDKSGILFYSIVIAVIAAVLALGIYAVASKYIENHPKEAGSEAAESKTVSDFIKEKDLSLDEFKEEYGLADEEIKEDDNIEAVSAKMTLENYAKYTDTTLDTLKSDYGLGEDVTADTKWQDAIYQMPTGVVAEKIFGMDFDTFKSQSGIPDTVTEDTLWSETNDIMNEIYASQQEQEADSTDGEPADNAEQSTEQENND
jgi:hypothetical protein